MYNRDCLREPSALWERSEVPRINRGNGTVAREPPVAAALTARGVTFNRIDHSHVMAVPCENRRRLEAFLHGCAGDDAVSLDTMLANPRVGAYLASCRTPDGAAYTFPQKVAHITL